MKRVLLTACIALAACESPMIPERSLADVYDYRLISSTPLTLRWPVGSTVAVFAADDPDATRTQWLRTAVANALTAWNAAALYNEVQLTQAGSIADADVVVLFTTTTSPVDDSSCAPGGGAAYTTFCLTADGEHLAVFPLRTGGGGNIKFVVTVRAGSGLTQETVNRLVAHEIGHTLGIAQHSPKPTDLMYGGVLQTAVPNTGDRATLQVLYHTAADVTP